MLLLRCVGMSLHTVDLPLTSSWLKLNYTLCFHMYPIILIHRLQWQLPFIEICGLVSWIIKTTKDFLFCLRECCCQEGDRKGSASSFENARFLWIIRTLILPPLTLKRSIRRCKKQSISLFLWNTRGHMLTTSPERTTNIVEDNLYNIDLYTH